MRFWRTMTVAMMLALAGCQDSGLDLAARSDKRVIVGPSVPVAIESLDGMPEAVAPRFSAAFTRAAQAREIAFVDAAGAPRFRLRGYLNAFASDGGTTLAWVFDVYDSARKRAQRVSGSELLKRSGGDPWGQIDEAALSLAANRGLDEVGAFLAAARGGAGAPVAAAPARPAFATSGD